MIELAGRRVALPLPLLYGSQRLLAYPPVAYPRVEMNGQRKEQLKAASLRTYVSIYRDGRSRPDSSQKYLYGALAPLGP